jgi:putative exosortase-associated protein (TIGR04073 family)
MRTSFSLLAAVLTVGLLTVGCKGPEKKLGRGFSNMTEFTRMGELRREVEQTALFESPEVAYTRGAVRGLHKMLARTFIGVYEVVTFPIPSYEPVFTDYLSEHPVYPDSYRSKILADSTFAHDTSLGFAGGDVAPMIPGSRFRIFDN